MAKITHPKDPQAGTRRRTTKGRGKWETMMDKVDSKRNSTTSWNRSTNTSTTPKKSTKNINKKR